MEIIKFIKKPKNIILCLMDKGYFNFLSDKIFIRLKYEILMNSKLNLENPKTFNESKQIAKRGGKFAGETRVRYENELGRKITSPANATNKKLLDDKK